MQGRVTEALNEIYIISNMLVLFMLMLQMYSFDEWIEYLHYFSAWFLYFWHVYWLPFIC